MGYRKTLRILLGVIKDKTSIIKATLLIKKSNYSTAHVAVLRATTHDESPPPPDTIAAVLSLGQGARPIACACVEALMDRLHGTQNATVALKCLFAIHNVLTGGSFIIKDQLSFYPSFGGHNYLNMSTFKDHFDPDMWQLSSWVRWYAGLLEQSVSVSRICEGRNKEERVSSLLNQDLLGELEVLIEFVDRVSDSPGASSSNNLVYEALRLVGKDYRLVQHEIYVRVVQLGDRIENLSLTELNQSMDSLGKLKGYKERLFSVFVRRSDGFWDLVMETEEKVIAMVKKKTEQNMSTMVDMSRMASRELVQFREERLGQDGWSS